ncbi:MAG: peptidoglycan DD-metalloendopeptidase family protein [Bacteroidales bacterium]|jgi:septal ring factor EnvC (AmiA/AmiB activator)|nr:peptidoglycan DD-metalloendopeptidase family protein [Bacteroidales bacterium]MDD2263518.1 peptidoglycan DD-metalloendopeptidase family protein [Bacteroidales bacterium]MDD2830692.1 peptidoglycan DD-metalloendopeptidase family protein [Bacteroidales bacterium]MDD3207891.1 peptidoglycan DD-metalloendopeptidase family protein [Bacteroidales bacterium]MDD3696602.1 peptidoglycan DD-metalloendopeptidase family protein [Bacteroidales bacterium]
MKRILLIIFFLITITGILQAQDVGELQARNRRLQQEIATLEKRISTTADDIRGQLNQHRLGQRLLSSRQELIRGMEEELARLNDSITKKNLMIARLKQERQELTTAYESLLLQAYRHRDKKLWIMHVLSSESALQAYRRWRYFRNYSDYMRTQEKKIRETEALLRREEIRLVSLQQERVKARDQLAREIVRMQDDQRKLNNNIRKLQQNEKQLKAALQKRIEEQRKLDNEIQKALAVLEKKDEARDPGAIEAARALSADFVANKGNLPWPLKDAVVIERFGRITDPKWGFVFDNKGVTLSGPRGGDVVAVFNGTVASIWMDNRDSYLIRVLVTHGEFSTIYCHMVDVVVREGDQVNTGQKIGTLSPLGEGSSYFQLLRNGIPVNPADWCR